MSDLKSLATKFASDHESGKLLVLPTVWDTWSAGLVEEAGFSGLTIGSHPVADATGSSDGENMNFADYMAVVKKITSAVSIPVSVDVESGYGLSPADLIAQILKLAQWASMWKMLCTARVSVFVRRRSTLITSLRHVKLPMWQV